MSIKGLKRLKTTVDLINDKSGIKITKKKSIVEEQPETPLKTLINKGKKSNTTSKKQFDYKNETVKPNTFDFEYQPKIIELAFSSVRSTVKRSPNDTIISSILAAMVERFSFFRVGTTYPFQNKVITSNIYSMMMAKSGSGKDLSARVIGELFNVFDKEIYNVIDWASNRYVQHIDELIKQVHENKDKVETLKAMKFLPHRSYVITEATNEGLMANIETFMKLGVGSVTWKIQEMGDMLLDTSDGSINMKLVKELYDSYSVYNKQIKSGHNVNISGVPFNVVGYTSPQGLNDDLNRKKIADKMARGNIRRFHVIAPTDKEYPILKKENLTSEQRLAKLKEQRNNNSILEMYSDKFGNIAKELKNPLVDSVENAYADNKELTVPGLNHHNKTYGKVFEWSDEAAIYFDEYEEYVNERWHTSSNEDGEQVGDLAYKVIKLLPLYCILNGSEEITVNDVKQTIYMVEYIYSHTHNTKELEEQLFENKIFEFMVNNVGQYYNKTTLRKKARCTTRQERSEAYIQEMIQLVDDSPDYELSIFEREKSGKTIIEYVLVPVEEQETLELEEEPVAKSFKVKL